MKVQLLLLTLEFIAMCAADDHFKLVVFVPVKAEGFFLEAHSSDTIWMLKNETVSRTSVGAENQTWFYDGQQLEDDQSVVATGLKDGARVDVGVCGATVCTLQQMLRLPTSCSEEESRTCAANAYCENYGFGGVCLCPEGMTGDGVDRRRGGSECNREAFSVRVSLDLQNSPLTASGNKLVHWEILRSNFGNLLFPRVLLKPAWFDTSMYHTVVDDRYCTINALFQTRAEAEQGAQSLLARTDLSPPLPVFGVNLESSIFASETVVVSWVLKTSEAELQILPTGMDVQNVYFKHDCLASGCWVIDLIYTIGEDNFNVFYIPKAVGNDELSYDFDYTAIPAYAAPYGKSPADTFLPLNFPCGSDGYRSRPGADIPDKVSACCIEEFTNLYRPVDTFVADPQVSQVLGASRDQYCAVNATRKIWNSTHLPHNALFGNFSGMNGLARVDFKSVEDPFIGQFTATVYLDEVALRQQAGMLTGAVGVAHSIDTFIGFANFKPTGLEFLDAFAAQTNIHLEKTNFFTVSAYGENQITFLEYVNLRLVAIYQEDDYFEATTGSKAFSRTNSSDAAHYLQVTFTLGAQYQPIETGIVPIDSVLVSKGDFISSPLTIGTRFHACSQYLDGSFPQQALFDSRFPTASTQTCAPNASMCYNPPHIPDQFVSFNVPLGIDWLPPASNDLDNNVFVDMVVSVIDAHQTAVPGGTPSLGDPAEQMKTTLTASIPVVEGGVYIFCDTITVKDDLLDIANADLILGSAGNEFELSRLHIIKDIASSPFDNGNATRIDSDSIEAGLMTLVIKGNESYFSRAVNYALEVEDVITIHVMEPETGTKYNELLRLLLTPAQDANIDTQGFALNGAFTFTVDRGTNRAALEPTEDLTQLCPFTPQRPNPDDAFPETCVSRRDIRARGFPARAGKNATAIELPAATVALDASEREGAARFMQLVLNPSDFSAQLGRNFSYLVGQKYDLNGRYNRAFWINPGYEWSPQQTGGQDIFTLSQKLVMFALINLDEGAVGLRRMLLQSSNPTQNSGAGVSGQQITFDTSPQSMMASLYSIPEELVATFSVQVQLSHLEACMHESELRRSVRSTLDHYIATATTHFETVQVLTIQLNKADVQCTARRNLSRRLHAFSPATVSVEILVVFSPTDFVAIDLELLANMPGVNSVSPLAVSDLIHISSLKAFPVSETYKPSAPSTNPSQGNDVPSGSPGAPTPLPQAAAGGFEFRVESLLIAVCAGATALASGVAYIAYKKFQQNHEREVDVISTVDIHGLKAELALP